MSSFVSYARSNSTTSHSISSLSLFFEYLDSMSWNKKNALEGRHFWRSLSMCSYYHYQDIYHLVHVVHNNYFLVQLLWTNCLQIYFFTRVLSIGARLVEESRGQFYFDNRDVQAKGSTKVFKFLKISFRAYNFITNKIIRSPNIFLQTKNTDVILSYYIFDF